MEKVSIRNQKALDFAMFMIAGSYFQKVDYSRMGLVTEQLLLQYKEQNDKAQYLMEDLCIGFMENFLIDRLPANIWKQCVRVRFLRTEESAGTKIRFIGEGFAVELLAAKRGGQKIRVSCRYRQRGGIERDWETEVRAKGADAPLIPLRRAS